MILHKVLHTRDEIDRLYVTRKEGRRGHANTENSVDASIQGLLDCMKKTQEKTYSSSTDMRTNRIIIAKKQKKENKQHRFDIKATKWRNLTRGSWSWPRKGNPQREAESLQIAVQNNAIRTNYVKGKIHTSRHNGKRMLFGNRDETINHIIRERGNWR